MACLLSQTNGELGPVLGPNGSLRFRIGDRARMESRRWINGLPPLRERAVDWEGGRNPGPLVVSLNCRSVEISSGSYLIVFTFPNGSQTNLAVGGSRPADPCLKAFHRGVPQGSALNLRMGRPSMAYAALAHHWARGAETGFRLPCVALFFADRSAPFACSIPHGGVALGRIIP